MSLRFIFVFFSIFLFNNLYCQYDTIKFSNGSKRAAKIIEISDKYVKYKNPLDTLGPTFSVRRKDVAGYVLKSGCIDMEQQGYINCVKDPNYELIKEKEFTRRIISVNAAQFFVKHFQMNAEYIFKNKKQSINLFYNFGFSDEKDKETYEGLETKMFSSGFFKKSYFGVDLKFFPSSHKIFTYYYAFGFDYGSAFRKQTTQYYDYAYLVTVSRTTFPEAKYFGYHFDNGVVWRIKKNFICQAVLALGVSQFTYEKENSKENERAFLPKISASINLGYAF